MICMLGIVLVLVCEVFLDRQVMDAGMHQQVDTDDLVESFHSESIDALQNREEEVAEDHSPDCTDGGSDYLYFELSEAATIDVPEVLVEDANSKASPVATEPVNLRCLDGIIDLHSFQYLIGDEVDDAADHSDHCGCPQLNVVA